MPVTAHSRSTSPRWRWVLALSLASVLMGCVGRVVSPPPVRAQDVVGRWRVVLIASSTRAELPADAFRVDFSDSGEEGVLATILVGHNTHVLPLMVDGERLASACSPPARSVGYWLCTSTLSGRRTRNPLSQTRNALTGAMEQSALSIRQGEDEELLRGVLMAPSAWRYAGNRLVIYSYAEMARMELEREGDAPAP